MPLTAIHKSNDFNVIVSTLDYESADKIREAFAVGSLFCPFCDCPMFPRSSVYKVPHFVHKRQNSCSSSGETYQHLFAKHKLAEQLREANPNDIITVEHRIPTLLSYRIIDVAQNKNGYLIAHEIQLSPITVEELQQRVNDYTQQGIESIWYFGETNAKNKAIKEYCYIKDVNAFILGFKTDY
ncbi:competence protein CoiA [Geminocystis sp. NIES-3709]|uniref:competence protein CoiA n=1 Tax=Geminocystis sp. NIES-3709 TaxID=1617448 RepID=UPI0005FCAFA9|nr:competence protein CoiA family protein [Geminocystis sp. NIES-3709]BAQ63905.1 putative glutathione peroxidase [Geminocystis sp. NIES-3709]